MRLLVFNLDPPDVWSQYFYKNNEQTKLQINLDYLLQEMLRKSLLNYNLLELVFNRAAAHRITQSLKLGQFCNKDTFVFL